MAAKRRIRTTIAVTVPPDLLKAIDAEAKKMGLTRSAFVSLGLSEFLRAITEPPDRKERT
jgi:hypothetical protein